MRSPSQENGCLLTLTQPHRLFDDHVEHRLGVGRRRADHPEHFSGRGLLLSGFGQRSPEAFDLGLQIGRWPCDGARLLEGVGAFLTELGLWAVLVPAPRTLHTGPPSELGQGRSSGGASLAVAHQGVRDRKARG